MTVCAAEPAMADEDGRTPQAGCAITFDGCYAARLARSGGSLFPERWTLDGPEPYAVPLPGNQPEEPGTEVQPMGDGRVLIRRLTDGRHTFSLLYPTGPDTGELPLGAVECPDEGTRLRLLPPAPGGATAYALAVGRRSSAVWQVAGGAFGPEHLAEVPGRCSGGVWLDGTGRMLALDREIGGRTKTVVVDLERAGEVSPLLQIAADSDDRLLLADPDSGLLLIRSDAPSPGRERLGWGVLGSTLPVRFPECLRVDGCTVTPFAIQPGQILAPESCAVALRIDAPLGGWIGVWRPAARQIQHLRAPEGWLAGAGRWTEDEVLHLPYATAEAPCGLARVYAPSGETGDRGETGETAETVETGGTGGAGAAGGTAWARTVGARAVGARAVGFGAAGAGGPVGGGPEEPVEGGGTAVRTGSGGYFPEWGEPSPPEPPAPVAPRPVPLQQAPLGRLVTN
ncbi:hypothetical protein M2271_006529 [Streptomyces sp. LBL]|uniref:hypothetical protein n=1 Tax=Streptomyces sp. LBL TaxID=2940562 RepID=UPI0024751FB9|nr:hypothetical protein [Streptomyces sp. LBL]MDH6628696.1 hypothetical protein [Streptomyces sp. LBL]